MLINANGIFKFYFKDIHISSTKRLQTHGTAKTFLISIRF